MSSIITLADEGYRQFGPLPATGGGQTAAQIAEIVSKFADYQAHGEWVRRQARQKGRPFVPAVETIDVLDRNADLNGKRLDFIDTYFQSEFATVDSPRLTTESDVLLSLMSDAREPPRWRGMYRLHQAIGLAGPQRLRPLFREHVAPCFFELYPGGKIVVVRSNPINDCAAALMRMLYAAAQAPLQDLATSGFDGIQTLQEWHGNSISQLGPVLLEIFLRLFYPYVGGYRGGLFGLDFLFLFEPAERHSPPLYPRDWFAIASNAAEFGREKTDFYKAIQDFQGPEWQHAAHQRVQHEGGYTVSERLALLRWYIDRVNRLLHELTDIANFTTGNDPLNTIDPVFAFEHSLTVDRLARKTLLAMSLQEVGTAKQLVFETADLYDGLSQLFGNHMASTGFFKQLFNTEQGPSLLEDRLRQLPAPFDTELTAWSQRIYDRIEDTIVGSVWFKSKVTPQGVLVRDKQLTQENPVPRPEFVAELMRAFRNAHHGYFSADAKSNNRPSRYLFLVDGNLPAEIMALPALWWLAYLADPSMIGWNQLPIGAFV